MTEHGYIRSVHRHLPAKGILVWKINDALTGGVPDCYYSGSTGDIWVEWKYTKSPTKRKPITPTLRSLQLRWLERQYAFGRNVYCIVGCPDGGFIFSEPDQWVKGIPPDKFYPNLKSAKELAIWITQKI